ncbi:Quinone oxidoreductase 1 [BD1-7 clade bacterium]|uniref:Quinone oxidoreductase 1 n=1 Tax=BD1-7 clade bacterium TaxID=2029982 RepID=A0A5S9PF53_9GAMM|nr:Quinone oxidoreductase 1 [BD1-7 clade bacterium]
MTQIRRQVVITKAGGPEVLKVQESPLPQLNKDEVTVAVAATGINFADILARQGLYQDAPSMPCTIGYEVAGTVTHVENTAHEHWIGKRVFGLTHFGGYTSHINIPIHQVFDIPAHLSFEEAASIPVAYLTAYQLTVVMGQLTDSESVLIQNAGGGVGLAILDIAKHIGATTIGTASSRKHSFLKDRGLSHAIDYNTQDWVHELHKLTDGRGVELITDPLGGKNWQASFKSLRATGRLGMFGISEASATGLKGKLKLIRTALAMPFFHPVRLMNENKSVFGVNMGRLWHESDKVREWMNELTEGAEAGWVRPHVDKTFSFENAGEAHAYIEARKNIGKVLLIP